MKLNFLFVVIISLFVSGAVSAQDVPVNMQLAKGYLLGPGDEITGKVLGEPDFDFVATVTDEGTIEVPFYNKPLTAKCLTERQLRSDVTALLQKFLKAPQLSLRVTDRKSRQPATIYGEVRSPQQVILMRKATLVEILAFSGGVTEDAGGMIQVFRTQPPLCSGYGEDSDWKATVGDPTDVPSRMYSLASVKMGKDDANPVIYPGDVVVVLRAKPVYITGEVLAPQGVYLKEEGLSLSEAIAKVGGVRREAKTKDIKVFRQKPNSKEREVLTANYDLIKQGKQKDILLEPYDIVQVDTAKDNIAQTILKFAVGAGKTLVSSGANSLGYRVMY